jgi:CheY-like chemotaxis protein
MPDREKPTGSLVLVLLYMAATMQPNADILLSVLTPDLALQRMFEPLRQEGVNVVFADSLQQAMQASVIFLDADHPVAGRRVFWQVAVRQILEMESDTVIVLISRLADEGLWIEALGSGAYDLLPKSCSPTETRCVVLGALARAEKLARARNAFYATLGSPVALERPRDGVKMSRDNHGATERCPLLNAATKTRSAEYSTPRVFEPAFNTTHRPVAPLLSRLISHSANHAPRSLGANSPDRRALP